MTKENNSAESCYLFARFHASSFEESISWYYKAAEQGHAKSQYIIGTYLFKRIIKRDDEEMVKWFRLATEQGNPCATGELGRCYMRGLGVTKNMTEAIRLFQIASDNGYSKASDMLGSCYKRGLGVLKDENESEHYFAKAREQKAAELVADYIERLDNVSDTSSAQTMLYLGKCYAYGCGVAQDRKLAKKWYTKAIKQDHNMKKYALYNIACLYLPWLSEIDIGDLKDIQKGIKYLYKSAKCGYPEAQYQLGCCYANGIGVEKNEEQSQYWLQLATK